MLKPSFILGYDPGGNDKHGVAVLEVARENQRWRARSLPLLEELETVDEVLDRVEKALIGPLIACGIDTLTAWGSGKSGWRPADTLLRDCYPRDMANSVDNPNHINGSMSLNGALVLHWLAQRADKGGMITEAHPKVCYFAIRKVRHPWWRADKKRAYDREAQAAQRSAKAWLLSQLGLPSDLRPDFSGEDHRFDALMGCLAALKGVSHEWTVDLHAQASIVHPFGRTFYWWPEALRRRFAARGARYTGT